MAKSVSKTKAAWMEYHVDAEGKRLGRLASDIAVMLQGKKTVAYEPNQVANARVIVKNLGGLDISQKKMEEKIYYRHTVYMGHLRELTLAQMWAKSPERVLREAVRRMLPKNFLNAKRLANLIVVEESKLS